MEKNMPPVSRAGSKLYKKGDLGVYSASGYHRWRGFPCYSLTLHRALCSVSTAGQEKGRASPWRNRKYGKLLRECVKEMSLRKLRRSGRRAQWEKGWKNPPSRLLHPQNSTFDRFSLFVSERGFRLFKMDSSGCQGNSVTIVTAMETFSVAQYKYFPLRMRRGVEWVTSYFLRLMGSGQSLQWMGGRKGPN